jgi:hypothetical protein
MGNMRRHALWVLGGREFRYSCGICLLATATRRREDQLVSFDVRTRIKLKKQIFSSSEPEFKECSTYNL